MERVEFKRRLVHLVAALKLRPVDLSEEFDASIPTVKRWLDGSSTPVPTMRKLIIQRLQQRLDRGVHTFTCADCDGKLYGELGLAVAACLRSCPGCDFLACFLEDKRGAVSIVGEHPFGRLSFVNDQ